MNNIYFYSPHKRENFDRFSDKDGQNNHHITAEICDELENILSELFTFVIINDFDNMSSDSILIMDFTGLNKNSWRSEYPDNLGLPKELLVDNIRVIPIIKKRQLSFAMEILENGFDDFIHFPFDSSRVIGTVMNTCRDIDYENELISLYRIGINLSNELDLDKLLQEILNVSIKFTDSDGASLFLVLPESDPETGGQMMRFEISVSKTLGNRYQKYVMPVNNSSLAGYVINTGRNLNIFDAYNLSKNLPYKFDPTLDRKNNYKSRTMLVVPMIDHKGRIIGAIQLINKKKDPNILLTSDEISDKNVLEYDHKNELLIRSLGSQATIAIENVKLYGEIQSLFESFMEASMRAVDSRDPNTAGHSRRVSKLSVAIANHINLLNNGELSRYNFSVNEIKSIKYAGLLHDFGKLGIPEKILLKEKKLYEEEVANIETRLEILKYSENVHNKNADSSEVIKKTEKVREAILNANAHAGLTGEIYEGLDEARKTEIILFDKSKRPVLTDVEYERLLSSRGSLSKEEFEVIKKHVEYTFNFLNLLKWPKGFERIPEISRFHHEKLDGSGYPLGLKGDNIPVESQILCIADIFDALTSKDRPYKKRISVSDALTILKDEAEKGKLNTDLVNMMIEGEIYKSIIDDTETI